MQNKKVIAALFATAVLALMIVYLPQAQNNQSINNVTYAIENEEVAKENIEADENEFVHMPVQEQHEQLSEEDILVKKLHEVILACKEYYSASNGDINFTTQNGFLYDLTSDSYISPLSLNEDGFLAPGYDVEGANILYVSPEDIDSALPLFDASGAVFSLYSVAPFEDGYILCTLNGDSARLTKEQYDGLLEQYNTVHGDMVSFDAKSDVYDEINTLLKYYTGIQDDFYIRYGTHDSKYAVVIFSPKRDYAKVKQFVLINNNDKWDVAIPDLESILLVKNSVTMQLHNFDVRLLPNYELATFKGQMIHDFDAFAASLVEKNLLKPEEKELIYASGTGSFAFLKYAPNKLFLGIKRAGVWDFTAVESAVVALKSMRLIDKNAADFILIWE